jgi:hypothetical protein
MAGITEFYCRLNETSHASQFKWLEYTFKELFKNVISKYFPFWRDIVFVLSESISACKSGSNPDLVTF